MPELIMTVTPPRICKFSLNYTVESTIKPRARVYMTIYTWIYIGLHNFPTINSIDIHVYIYIIYHSLYQLAQWHIYA